MSRPNSSQIQNQRIDKAIDFLTKKLHVKHYTEDSLKKGDTFVTRLRAKFDDGSRVTVLIMEDSETWNFKGSKKRRARN